MSKRLVTPGFCNLVRICICFYQMEHGLNGPVGLCVQSTAVTAFARDSELARTLGLLITTEKVYSFRVETVQGNHTR